MKITVMESREPYELIRGSTKLAMKRAKSQKEIISLMSDEISNQINGKSSCM